VNIDVSCGNSIATLFWSACLVRSSNIDNSTIETNAYALLDSDIDHPNNFHYGFLNFWTPSSPLVLTIPELRPASTYNITAFC
jgi:hypothetical protein